MIARLVLIAIVADTEDMAIILVILLGIVAVGLLATRYGADSRHVDPRDLRSNI